MPIILNGDTGITTPTYGGADAAEYLVPVTGFKNRIINGAMQIDQRNAGASVTNGVGDTYTIDRWKISSGAASKLTVQQNAGSVTPPAGFRNYVGLTSTSAYSIGTSDYFVFQQAIEGLNLSDLGWGTASAQTVTLSFKVRSSLTGTFGGAVRNNDSTRNYPFSFTISSANTWEDKTITIAGDTTGTWLTTNEAGINLGFGMGVGSTYSGTAGAWTGSTVFSATGAVSVVGTNGATFYITGVQLEKGTTATSFDYRPFGTELSLCQRYYYKTYSVESAIGSNEGPTTGGWLLAVDSASAVAKNPFAVTMRATPTVTPYQSATGVAGTMRRNIDGVGVAVSIADINQNGFSRGSGSFVAGQQFSLQFTASAEL